MLVTNLTTHCYVLSAGVIIQPNATDVTVSDATYQADSTLNQQIDALEAHDFISITGKPTDPWPITTGGQLIEAVPGQTAFTIEGVNGSSHELVRILDQPDGLDIFLVTNDGFVIAIGKVEINANGETDVPLTLRATSGQTADLLQVHSENAVDLLKVSHFGTVNIALDGEGGAGFNATPMLTLDQQGIAGEGLVINIAPGLLGADSQIRVTVDPDGDDIDLFKVSNQGQAFFSGDGTNDVPVFTVRGSGQVNQALLIVTAETGQDVFRLGPDGSLTARDSNGNVRLLLDAAGNFFVNADYLGDVGSGQFKVNQDGGVQIFPPIGFPGSAGLLKVWDTDGDLAFEVRADGTIHAKTGGSIHFDL